VVVELTPPGRGAVAVVTVDGPRALEVIRHFFVPVTAWPASGPPLGRIMLGRWGDAIGEELVVCRREANRFEIHCHGGAAAAPAIVRQLAQFDCTTLSWQEWLRHSESDPIRAAARIDLADAPTARTAGILLDQYHGALTTALASARAEIAAHEWTTALEIVRSVLAFRDVGLHLTMPWRVVIAGPPNVGKSSLINSMAGFQRAIVSPAPGTTRDVVTLNTAIDGWPVLVSDTAGWRKTNDELEMAGVELASAAVKTADLVLLVSDATRV
jgi:tRNA modification GTPase